MALAPASSGSGPVIAEVEMNAGADQGATTVRATVVQACTVFYDTPATLANQFCRGKDYPPPPEYVFAGLDEEPSPDTVVCPGGSVIISPSGEVLAGPNYGGEALIMADLDLGEIVRAKFDFNVVGYYARPEVLAW